MTAPAISCIDITLRYGQFTAFDDVSVDFERGMIHALVGQNGAGKSSLARVISGVVAASEGTVAIDGGNVPAGDVIAARKRGVAIVHQNMALPPTMSVAEALEYGMSTRRRPFYRKRRLDQEWQAYVDEMGIDVDVRQQIQNLPIETLQGIEIARALSGDARILILDEPTAVLPPTGISRLFQQVRKLKDQGVTVIIVLHKVREVLEIADTITVLRRGRLILETVPAETVTIDDFTQAIIGSGAGERTESVEMREEIAALDVADRPAVAPAEPVDVDRILTLEGVSTRSRHRRQDLDEFTAALHSHQIVGIAGVEGNGQVALVEALAGLADVVSGDILMDGESVNRLPQAHRRQRGLRIIPFERNTEGLSRSSPLWQNWAIPQLARPRGSGLVDRRKLRAEAKATLERWDVAFSSVDQTAGELSGGNAQKVILAREIDDEARIIVAAQPTRGLDLGAVSFVWRALREARDRGSLVVLISSDLDELAEMSDRILVMTAGRNALDVRPPYDFADIGAAMTGATA